MALNIIKITYLEYTYSSLLLNQSPGFSVALRYGLSDCAHIRPHYSLAFAMLPNKTKIFMYIELTLLVCYLEVLF